MKTGLKNRQGKVVSISRGVIRQRDLAEIGVLEGDLLEIQKALEAKRAEIATALLHGVEVEPGPLRAFLERYEKVTKSGSSVRIRLIVR